MSHRCGSLCGSLDTPSAARTVIEGGQKKQKQKTQTKNQNTNPNITAPLMTPPASLPIKVPNNFRVQKNEIPMTTPLDKIDSNMPSWRRCLERYHET